MAGEHGPAGTCGPGCRCRLDVGRDEGGPPVDLDDWSVRRRRSVWRAAGARATGRRADVAAVLLDMGGVVIPTLFESVAVPGFPGGPLGDEPDYAAVERGDLPERDYWARLAGRRPDLDVSALWRACSRVRAEVRAAMGALAGRVRLVAFTNDMAHWFGPGWPSRFPELASFDQVVEATRLGVLKPDPEAFRLAAAEIGEPPQRCLFVDDLAVNLDGAAAVGMQIMLFKVRDPGGSIAALLGRLGLTPDPPRGPGRVFTVR